MAENKSSFIEDVYQSMHERLKNPFVFAFLVSWVLHNWRLVFALFNLPENFNYISKMGIIYHFIKEAGFCGLLIEPAIYALLAIMTYYFLSIAGSALSLLNERKLQPIVNKAISESAVVKLDRFEFLQKGYTELKSNFDKLADLNTKLSIDASDARTEKQQADFSVVEMQKRVEEMERKVQESNQISIDSLDPSKKHINMSELDSQKFAGIKIHFPRSGEKPQSWLIDFEFPKEAEKKIVPEIGSIKYTVNNMIHSWHQIDASSFVGMAINPVESPSFDLFHIKRVVEIKTS